MSDSHVAAATAAAKLVATLNQKNDTLRAIVSELQDELAMKGKEIADMKRVCERAGSTEEELRETREELQNSRDEYEQAEKQLKTLRERARQMNAEFSEMQTRVLENEAELDRLRG